MTIEERRREMVHDQIAHRGIVDERILSAMERVPREVFLDDELQEFAYSDTPLPIASDQTISQPYIVALMTSLLDLPERGRVLEIGTGSGYAAAVLAEVADEVWTVERHGDLARSAEELLRRLGYDNVHVRHGDGTRGWQEHAPFHGIVVAAGGPRVPESLRRQLTIGGRLVIPVGDAHDRQELVRVTRTDEESWEREELGAVRFVPLVGDEGW